MHIEQLVNYSFDVLLKLKRRNLFIFDLNLYIVIK